MVTIKPETRIGEIMEKYPETLEVFAVNGFEASSKADLMMQLDAEWMLKTVLKVQGLNIDLFIRMLEEKIEETRGELVLPEQEKPIGKLNFYGHTNFFMNAILHDFTSNMLDKYNEKTGKAITGCVPLAKSDKQDYNCIWDVEDIEDFPDIVCTTGFSKIYHKGFIEKFVKNGCFKTAVTRQVNRDFEGLGLVDPNGWYTVYAVNPWIMMVDEEKLGSLPMPHKWEDLLNPVYKNNIIIEGSKKNVSNLLLLMIYKKYGETGIAMLANNVKDTMHPSKMSNLAGKIGGNGCAIYILPWVFTKVFPEKKGVSFIWPEDGAIISPMYMLAKKEKIEELRFIIDFVTGADYGQKSADLFYPSLNPEVDNKLPENTSFQWLGWDYVMETVNEGLVDYTRELFAKYWKRR